MSASYENMFGNKMHAACALNQSGYPDALYKQLASLRFLLQFLVMFGVQLPDCSIALSPEFNCKCSPTINHPNHLVASKFACWKPTETSTSEAFHAFLDDWGIRLRLEQEISNP